MKQIIALLIFLVIPLNSLYAENFKINLYKNWKISFSDNTSNKEINFDDSTWEKINLPALLSKHKKRQTIWLRKSFIIPKSFSKEDLSIFLGKIWDVDNTYLNGEKIGNLGSPYPTFASAWNFDRVYFLPNKFINFGKKNTIVIKIFSNQNANFNGKPFVGKTRDIELFSFWKRFKAQYLSIGMAFIMLFLGLTYLIQFFMDRSNRLLFHYALISFFWVILSGHFFMIDFGIPYNLHDKLYYSFLTIEIVLIYFFLEEILKIRIKFLKIPIYVMGSIAIIICLSSTQLNPVTGWRSQAIGFLGILSQIAWGIVIIKSIKKIQAKWILAAYIVFVICLIHDILAISLLITYDFYWINIGYPAMIMAFGVILSYKAVATSQKLQISTQEIEIKNNDLNNLLNQIKESVGVLSNFSVKVQETTTNLKTRMESQGTSLEETSAATEEITASFQIVTENSKKQYEDIKDNQKYIDKYVESTKQITEAAKTASSLSKNSQIETKESQKNLEKIVNGMNKIKNSSGAIKEITEIINEISEQTNLLSLNASIEAARAGEHGRGFAVVAEEIGKLADRSIQQSKSIQEIVNETLSDIVEETEIVTESSKTINGVQSSVTEVDKAIDSIFDLCISQEELTEKIQNNMQSISDKAGEISTSSSEQNITIIEVSKALEELTGIMYGVILGSDKLMEAFENLQNQIHKLKEITGTSEKISSTTDTLK